MRYPIVLRIGWFKSLSAIVSNTSNIKLSSPKKSLKASLRLKADMPSVESSWSTSHCSKVIVEGTSNGTTSKLIGMTTKFSGLPIQLTLPKT